MIRVPVIAACLSFSAGGGSVEYHDPGLEKWNTSATSCFGSLLDINEQGKYLYMGGLYQSCKLVIK